jgi:hypothetical protein
MGLSSNQARFLSLTARQVDLEQRVQQICQRRLRLSSELERVATSYNNSISNRKLFVPTQSNLKSLSFASLAELGFQVFNNLTNTLASNLGLMNLPGAPNPAATVINSEADLLSLVAVMNGGDAAATAALAGNYVLNCDIDLSDNGTFSDAFIQGNFTGTFDGQGRTVSGLTINSTQSQVGFFSSTGPGASISNLALTGVDITSTGSQVGGLVGYNRAVIDNCYAEGVVRGEDAVGGLVGYNYQNTISNSFANVAVSGDYEIGGFVGYNDGATADISKCYATGNVTGNTSVGGFVGRSFNNGTIADSYATGNVNGVSDVGGFIGKMGWVSILNSYATGAVTGSGVHVGGFAGETWTDTASSIDNTSFWNTDVNPVGMGSNIGGIFDAQGLTTAQIAANNYTANGGWNAATWDMSGTTPTLKGTNASIDLNAVLEEYLRNGTFSLVREADEYTQTPIGIAGVEYEKIDWRTVPGLNDELYKGDDVDAENKYDKIIFEINSQDKKLQLEQTSVEVEYKAISAEKEAVKKILDTNASSSFKYFS